MPEELHRVETNAPGDENDAMVWGVRFELLCLGLSGVAASIVIIAALIWLRHLSLAGVVFAGCPAVATLGLAWFKQTHPPGHDSDLLDLWFHGPGFGPKPPSEPIL